MIRRYSELHRIETFEDRYKYLALQGRVGDTTFGFDRYLNQRFYSSGEWKQLRQYVLYRDNACDLGVEGYEIHSKLIIHHMNPMTIGDIVHREEAILDPEFLITTTLRTHNAIHYGDERLLVKAPVVRKPGDTKLW